MNENIHIIELDSVIGKFRFSEDKNYSAENLEKISYMYGVLSIEYFQKPVEYKVPTEKQLIEKKKGKHGRLVFTEGAKRAKERIKKFHRFVDICKELNVSFETFMRVQFKAGKDTLSQSHYRSRLDFGFFSSESAIERFNQLATSEEKSINFFGERKEEENKPLKLDIKSAVDFSAEKYYNKLLKIIETDLIDFQTAVMELEFLSRLHMVTNIYVFVSPIVEESNSIHLLERKRKVARILTEEQRNEAQEVHKGLHFDDQRIAIYV